MLPSQLVLPVRITLILTLFFPWAIAVLPACGGAMTGDEQASDEESGVSDEGSGISRTWPSCPEGVMPGTQCWTPSEGCLGPCSNGWQTTNQCTNGAWQVKGLVPCGPDPANAPECRDGFSGGTSPCCPEGGLDCNGRPEGYPGFDCVPRNGDHCSCHCSAGEAVCAC